jgi:hypothetical protein
VKLWPLLLFVSFGCFLPALFCFGLIFVQFVGPSLVSDRVSCINLSALYIAVICIDPMCNRGRDLYHSWGGEFMLSGDGSMLQFFMASAVPFFQHCSQVVPFVEHPSSAPDAQGKRPPVVDHAFYLNYASAHYFLENTTLHWYIRTTYDTYVHLPHLRALIADLNAQYSPLTDIVLKGEMISHHGHLLFIHGGPGWIMSRAAVEKFVEYEGSLTELFQSSTAGDDVFMAPFASWLNLTHKDVFSPLFCGPPISPTDYEQLNATKSFAVIEVICPLTPAFHRLLKVRDLVFLHNGESVNWAALIGRWMIDEAPDDVYIEAASTVSRLCRTDDRHEKYLTD